MIMVINDNSKTINQSIIIDHCGRIHQFDLSRLGEKLVYTLHKVNEPTRLV